MRPSSLVLCMLAGLGSLAACARATRDFGLGGGGSPSSGTTTATTGSTTATTGGGGGSTSSSAGTGGTGGGTTGCNGGKSCASPADCPPPTTACVNNICVAGCCGTAPTAKGTPCTDNGGVVCDGNGTCTSMHCTDGIQDADETDVDCGGATCPACPLGKKCAANADCISKQCTAGICAPSCTDGVKDGTETDVDCGGGTCPPCAAGKSCLVGSDCQSGTCDPTTHTCTASSNRPVAIESVAGSCYTMPGEVDSLAQSVLTGAGFTVQIVDGNALATQAGINQFGVVVFGSGSFNCAWDWNLFDAQLQAYVMGGGGVVVTGWGAYYMAMNTANQTYPGMASILPVIAGTASPSGQLDTIVPGHPLTSGLAGFTNPSYTAPGAGTPASATPLLKEGSVDAAAAWTVGSGRVVYLGPVYLANFANYTNKGLLDGTIPSAKQLFVNSVLWAAHKI